MPLRPHQPAHHSRNLNAAQPGLGIAVGEVRGDVFSLLRAAAAYLSGTLSPSIVKAALAEDWRPSSAASPRPQDRQNLPKLVLLGNLVNGGECLTSPSVHARMPPCLVLTDRRRTLRSCLPTQPNCHACCMHAACMYAVRMRAAPA